MLLDLPREVAFHGVYMPIMTLLFIVAALLGWGLDRVFAWVGLYRFTWHPALFRVCLFACLFGALSLTVYR
ncbi:efflux system membrane protein [compost metagenome]